MVTVKDSNETRPAPDGGPPAGPPPRRPDAGFLAIVALVVVVVGWLLLMPWVPPIATATLRRFHLRTDSFAVWAIQQPIPAMYNFANRFEVRDRPSGFVDPLIDSAEKRYLNHFPTRVMTFANTRYRYLHDGQNHWFTLDSSYRGQTIETRWHAKPHPDGGFEMILLGEEIER